MKELFCKVIDKKFIGDKEYFILEDPNTKQEYTIPSIQLKPIDILIGESYKFYKAYNNKLEKYFLEPEHPIYKRNKVHEFDIVEIITSENKQGSNTHYFNVRDINGNICKVRAFDWQINNDLKKIKCKISGLKYGKPILINADFDHPYYKMFCKYKFEIIEFSFFIDKRSRKESNLIIVEDKQKNRIKVPALPWQNKNIWTYTDLVCEVIGFDSIGLLKLRSFDQRHPKFRVGQKYDFEILGFKKKQNIRLNKEYEVIELLGIDNCRHDVLTLPNQEQNLEIGEKISCEIRDISNKIKLKQITDFDPYFYNASSIINDTNLVNKYFYPALNNTEDIDCVEMASQYNTESAFWIFTFCNKILHKIFYENVFRYSYETAIEINRLISKVEKWIIRSGIIASFPDRDKALLTKKKASFQYSKTIIIDEVLQKIKSLSIDEYINNINEDNLFEKLFYLLSFCNIELIEPSKIIQKIISFSKGKNFDEKQKHYLNRLNNVIYTRKQKFIDSSKIDFSLSDIVSVNINKKDLEIFLSWTYCQYIINKLLNDYEYCNLLIAQIFRRKFYLEDNVQNKIILLNNSFYILSNYKDKDIPNAVNYEVEVTIDFSKINENPNMLDEKTKKYLDEIINSYNENKPIKVTINRKLINGYEIEYQGIQGFLPHHHINDSNLKHYKYYYMDWDITVYCVNYSENFNIFIAKQTEPENKDHISENKLINKNIINEVINGEVNNIEDYGIFMKTNYGDGLLHIANISDEYVNKTNLTKIFKIGNSFKVYVKNVKDDGKMDLSLKDLPDYYSDYKYDFLIKKAENNIVDQSCLQTEVEPKTDNSFFDIEKSIDTEKAFCLEQFVLTQIDYKNKIHYLVLAKQFFSVTQNARSYLLNLYIEYFNCLIDLEKVINDYTFDKYEITKQGFKSIKGKIQPETLEKFPGSEKLIYFVNILSNFNEHSEKTFEELFGYIKKYSKDDSTKLISILGKITLSNNLLISESEESEEFAKKNLKRIFSYIKDGVFSLEETEDDKLERELKEKTKYWQNKIKLGEGEKLEFKSTFKTPVLDKEKKALISKLKEEMSLTTNPESIKNRIDEISGDKASKKIIHSALKTIAAFSNTNGGDLLIGVSDEREIHSLKEEYNSFKNKKSRNRDGLGKYFDEKIKEYFGDSFSPSLLRKEFIKFPEGDILIIIVEPSDEEIFLLKDDKGKKIESLYVRNLSSSIELKGKELATFIKKRQRERFKNDIEELEKHETKKTNKE